MEIIGWKRELGWALVQQSPYTQLDRGPAETHIWLGHDPTKTPHANEIQFSIGLLPFFLFSFSPSSLNVFLLLQATNLLRLYVER
jgi:hypothetical protein